MSKSSTKTCSITLPLILEKWQIDRLNKRFELARNLYNTIIGFELKKLNKVKQLPEYREITLKLSELPINSKNEGYSNEAKMLLKQRSQILDKKGFTEFGFTNDMTRLYKCFKPNIGSITAQSIANNAWTSFKSLLYGNGKKIHFKKHGEINTISGKPTNKEIRFKRENNTIEWNGLTLGCKVKKDNEYENTMLEHKVKFVRIVRKWVRTKYNFYAQIIIEGTPEKKINKQTGELKYPLGKGRVGIDIGTSTIAYVANSKIGIEELAPKVDTLEKELRVINRRLDRSRRATNPDNFNPDGTIKRGKKLIWKKSKRYLSLIEEKKELFRKQADIRKLQHNILSNKLIILGDEFYIEDMNIKALSRRAQLTEISEKTGRYKRKSRFGKSISNKAPSMLMQILDNKLKSFNKGLIKINTVKAKASQFDHISEEYHKKSLSTRWAKLSNGDIVQRDLYSAFLIQNINETLDNFNMELIDVNYCSFKTQHDILINDLRLDESPRPSSIGINCPPCQDTNFRFIMTPRLMEFSKRNGA